MKFPMLALTMVASAAVLTNCAGGTDVAETVPAVDVEVAVNTGPDLSPAVEGDPMGVVVHKLPNGLTLMLSENHDTPRIQTWIVIRAGSAKDPADSTGMAHYLEHMLFKGTSSLGTTDWAKEKPHLDRIQELYEELFTTEDPEARKKLYAAIDKENQEATKYSVPSEFDRLYDVYGANGLNAFTSNDMTVYVVDMPANRLQTWAEVERERFTNPVFRLFQSELEAVYEEKNRANDNASRAIDDAMMKAVFPKHPYGYQPTLGTTEHLKNPSLAKMYQYFHDWYVPSNMCVVLSGDFDTAEAVEILTEQFGQWEAKDAPPNPVFPADELKGRNVVELQYEDDETVQIAIPTAEETHPDHDALVLCDMMLDNQQTGLINVNINQAQKTRSAGSNPRFMKDRGAQFLRAVPKPGQTLEECEELLFEQLTRLKAGEFSDEDLAAVITDFEITRKRELEQNASRVRAMGMTFINEVPWSHRVEELDRMRKLTKADVVAAANKYFGDDYVVGYRRRGVPDIPAVEKPGFTKIEIPKGRQSAFFKEMSEREIDPLEPYFLEQDRDYVVHELRSGKLYWAQNPVNDLFQISIQFEVGHQHDAALRFAFPLINFGGAGDLDAVAYKRKLYGLGTTIGGGSGPKSTTISVTGLDANFADGVALMREHLKSPTGADDTKLKGLVQQILGYRNTMKVNPQGVFQGMIQYALRGERSDFLKQPTNEELQQLTAADLLAAVDRLWNVKRTVVYVGSMAPEEVAALIDSPEGATLADPPAREPVRYEEPTANRVLFADKDSQQSSVLILTTDGVYDRSQVPTSRVYNEYMGGSMGSIVFQEVREARSLAYSVGSRYQNGGRQKDGNLYWGQMGTQPDKTVEAVDVLLGLMRKMPAQEDRFAMVQKSIADGYRTNRITFRSIPGAALGWHQLGLEGDPRPWNWDQIKNMQLTDVTGWSSKFEKRPFTVVIVGPSSRIDMKGLEAFGEIQTIDPNDLFAW